MKQKEDLEKTYSMSEDEYDIMIADDSYKEYVESGKNSRPLSELEKELDYK